MDPGSLHQYSSPSLQKKLVALGPGSLRGWRQGRILEQRDLPWRDTEFRDVASASPCSCPLSPHSPHVTLLLPSIPAALPRGREKGFTKPWVEEGISQGSLGGLPRALGEGAGGTGVRHSWALLWALRLTEESLTGPVTSQSLSFHICRVVTIILAPT